MQNFEHQGDAGKTTVPMVSIVVPCRNERDHIESAIKSILTQEVPPGGFEVIVADGMSDDGTREILKKWVEQDSRLHLIDNPGGIVSSGLNAGIRKATGSIIMRMDVHTNYAPDYVRQAVRVLEETGADNVGGPWLARGRGRMGMAIAAAFQSPFACGGARGHDPNYSGPVDTVYLGCWRRKIFDRIGFFDEELVRNQDDEFNLRTVRSGGKVWQSATIRSWYYTRESLRHLFGQYLQYGYWKVRVIQKHRLPASLRHLVPPGFLLCLILLPILSLFWPTILWLWVGLIGFYVAINVLVSIWTAVSDNWRGFPLLPLTFATFHFAYGWGFLRGFIDFIIFRRGSRRSYNVLTRASGEATR